MPPYLLHPFKLCVSFVGVEQHRRECRRIGRRVNSAKSLLSSCGRTDPSCGADVGPHSLAVFVGGVLWAFVPVVQISEDRRTQAFRAGDQGPFASV